MPITTKNGAQHVETIRGSTGTSVGVRRWHTKPIRIWEHDIVYNYKTFLRAPKRKKRHFAKRRFCVFADEVYSSKRRFLLSHQEERSGAIEIIISFSYTSPHTR